MTLSAPNRRYTLRLLAAMGGYLATLYVAKTSIGPGGLAGSAALAVALLPALCVAAVFWALGRLLVEQPDEYQRLLLNRQLLIGSAITLTLATVWGFWEDFGLVGHIDAWLIAPIFFISMGVGALVNKLTLGDSGAC